MADWIVIYALLDARIYSFHLSILRVRLAILEGGPRCSVVARNRWGQRVMRGVRVLFRSKIPGFAKKICRFLENDENLRKWEDNTFSKEEFVEDGR